MIEDTSAKHVSLYFHFPYIIIAFITLFQALQNAPVMIEDFLVSPLANIVQSENPILEDYKKQGVQG